MISAAANSRGPQCSAERPVCARCQRKELTCEYDVEEGEPTRYSALKRKYDEVMDENERLRELFDYLSNRPESEAQEIWKRIRFSGDVQEVIQAVRDAEILLRTPSDSGHGPLEATGPLERLEQQALEGSFIKLPSRPWTTVAGDGIVSELISSFFAYDDLFFLPFIDKEAFVEEMRSKDPRSAKYCSAFLVNAICALRSVRAAGSFRAASVSYGMLTL